MSESHSFQLPRKQAPETVYKQYLDMDCLAYVRSRTKLMSCNLDPEIHLGFEFHDEEKQRFLLP